MNGIFKMKDGESKWCHSFKRRSRGKKFAFRVGKKKNGTNRGEQDERKKRKKQRKGRKLEHSVSGEAEWQGASREELSQEC